MVKPKLSKTSKSIDKSVLHVYDGMSATFLGRYKMGLKKQLKNQEAPLKSGKNNPNVILVYPKSLNKKDIDEYQSILKKFKISKQGESK